MKILEQQIEQYKIKISHDFVNDELASHLTDKKYFICLDKRVKHFYQDYLQELISNAQDIIVIDALEKNKNQDSINNIMTMLYENNADRNSVIIALGGGIIGDLTGFAAATYMRGIKLIHVPTTMLAMCDSCIGNKVAINYQDIKNLIGTFYAPSLVIIDIYFLQSLTSRLFKEGLVELIKHGLIADKNILEELINITNLDQLRNHHRKLISLINKSIKVKANIVKQDPFDHKIRHQLNFGHAIAHCLELGNDNDYFHGEAVAIGMLLATSLNEGNYQNEVFITTKNILEKYECIRELKPINFDLLAYDKKKDNENIKEIFLPELNRPVITKYNIADLIKLYQEHYQQLKTLVKQTKQQFLFKKAKLHGLVNIPPSKSLLHRYLFGAMLAQDITTITNVISLNNDVLVTIRILQSFNVNVSYNDDILTIDSTNLTSQKSVNINMQESAASLRISLPIMLFYADKINVRGQRNLPKRPIDPFIEIFKENDISYEIKSMNDFLPLEVSGKFKNNVYKIPGNISSQFISGLLFALPLLPHDSSIILTSHLESLSYVKMSVEVLRDFGIKISHNDNFTLFKVTGQQKYQTKKTYEIEQDYSSRTFFEVANALGNNITFNQTIKESNQDEYKIHDLLKNKNKVFDLQNMPDAAPALAIYLIKNGGTMNAVSRLKFKESDRLKAIKDFLAIMNIENEEKKNTLTIHQGVISGGHFNTYHDHRITMALIIASTQTKEPIILDEITSINKSFPNFIEEYEKLGGFIDEK